VARDPDWRSRGAALHADGKRRCAWCGTDPLYVAYHDTEWGVAVHEDQTLFEMLCLEGAQAGLSWITVLRKRETYRLAFDGFDARKMAAYGPRSVRACSKIPALSEIDSRSMRSSTTPRPTSKFASGSDPSIDTFGNSRTAAPSAGARSISRDSRTSTPESDAMSKELKKNGFRFVGTTICYAFMQAVGIVDEHQRSCWAARRSAGVASR
jgi:DNA-3-methyladenine glycosylase I